MITHPICILKQDWRLPQNEMKKRWPNYPSILSSWIGSISNTQTFALDVSALISKLKRLDRINPHWHQTVAVVPVSQSRADGSRGGGRHSPSQSAPTILVLKTWVGLWPWKKLVQNMGSKNQGAKNRVIVIQKEKRPLLFRLPLLFLNALKLLLHIIKSSSN